MSDDEADPELVELLRQSLLGLGGPPKSAAPPETKVLQGAQYIFDNAIDVALDPLKTKAAAETIWQMMRKKRYSMETWSTHELHPKNKDEKTVDFIFTMDLLNFSFWSDERVPSKRFAIEYRGERWTGYWSLVAALQRALDEEIPITSPEFWDNEDECTEEILQHVFRSATDDPIPLFQERVRCLREAGQIICDKYDGSFVNCIEDANGSAAGLVNLLAEDFPCFKDEATYEGRKVRFYKRAQILVADLWACFEGREYGSFNDIHKITMFADYRIPQMLHQLNCLMYSPPLESHIRQLKELPSGHRWELELRGVSIWAIELILQEIRRTHPEAYHLTVSDKSSQVGDEDAEDDAPDEREKGELKEGGDDVMEEDKDNGAPKEPQSREERDNVIVEINAILIDFFLYDTMKETEKEGQEAIPHHRTRSIWY